MDLMYDKINIKNKELFNQVVDEILKNYNDVPYHSKYHVIDVANKGI